MKIKVDLDDDLPLHKKLEICSITIVVRAVFHEESIYYPTNFPR